MTPTLLKRSGRGHIAAPLPLSGSYVTDGHRLFRVVSQFSSAADHVFASLEDCLTLEIQPYAPGELLEMGLRPVSAARRPPPV